jgi:hypothetical protein
VEAECWTKVQNFGVDTPLRKGYSTTNKHLLKVRFLLLRGDKKDRR